MSTPTGTSPLSAAMRAWASACCIHHESGLDKLNTRYISNRKIINGTISAVTMPLNPIATAAKTPAVSLRLMARAVPIP